MGQVVKLKNVRINFPSLFEKNVYKGKGSYKAHFYIEKNSEMVKLLDTTFDQIGNETFGAKWGIIKKTIENNNQKTSYYDGVLKSQPDYMVLSASSKRQPPVYHANKQKATVDDNPVYGGCHVNAVVELYGDKANGGIYCNLSGVQFLKDGDPFAGGYIARDDDFESLSDDVDILD